MRSTLSMGMLKLPVDRKRDHMRGPTDAPVTLVEYGDFECPHCGQAHLVVDQIEKLLGDALCFVFRHFPLNTVQWRERHTHLFHQRCAPRRRLSLEVVVGRNP